MREKESSTNSYPGPQMHMPSLGWNTRLRPRQSHEGAPALLVEDTEQGLHDDDPYEFCRERGGQGWW
jgi:hypothetical protein